ncbi:hypothetical protein G3T14_16785 [Methylobacterium sp. BTF04]|uniref:hypothetical protein n=1 Tax=Methylobacterium sp. BTF04 TaxID=2708300 RepID=UPI0013D24E02|nr:hypothetical protein [Methylobacterium sp. BTF04]NEU13775.1 hypothetical protein [Methylobacterium sp. BTF04]
MPHHVCIDPNDQYAQAEVTVEFETTTGVVRLLSVHGASDDDILPDLDDVQRRALESEILEDHSRVVPAHDGPPHTRPIMDHRRTGTT